MKLGFPKESAAGERRVAATPESVRRLTHAGFMVSVEQSSGLAAGFDDDAYRGAGARIADAAALFGESDILVKVRPPSPDEAERLRPGALLVSLIYPAQNSALVARLAARGVDAIAMDQVPRTTRAQRVDALSSMANLAGYRAVIEAAEKLPRPLGGQTTAAGKIPPARMLVIGAGVAGLAAIGAARALGALVRAFDTRPATREQVQSMGAQFLEVTVAEEGAGGGGYAREMSPAFIAAEMAIFAAQAREVDIIVSTALIPGKPAPKLITRAMVESMRSGSVIVDLAAEQGGNCELTVPGQSIVHRGVTIVGYTDLPSRLPAQASALYAANVAGLLDEMGGAARFAIAADNDIVRPMTVVRGGRVVWPPPRPPEAQKSPPPAVAPTKPMYGTHHAPPVPETQSRRAWVFTAAVGLLLFGIGLVAPAAFLTHFTVFVLSCFIGYQVIWSVTPALHTPLMSVTNAISGIIVLGGMLQIAQPKSGVVAIVLGATAILVSMINIAGGFLVTQRMLRMFHK